MAIFSNLRILVHFFCYFLTPKLFDKRNYGKNMKKIREAFWKNFHKTPKFGKGGGQDSKLVNFNPISHGGFEHCKAMGGGLKDPQP